MEPESEWLSAVVWRVLLVAVLEGEEVGWVQFPGVNHGGVNGPVPSM